MERRCRIVLEPGPTGTAITLSVRGKIDEEALAEMDQLLTKARGERMRIYIDLGEVTLVDHEAARALAARILPDAICTNCPEYLRRWIGADAGPDLGPDLRNKP